MKNVLFNIILAPKNSNGHLAAQSGMGMVQGNVTRGRRS
jgi:hypothetical protein